MDDHTKARVRGRMAATGCSYLAALSAVLAEARRQAATKRVPQSDHRQCLAVRSRCCDTCPAPADNDD